MQEHTFLRIHMFFERISEVFKANQSTRRFCLSSAIGKPRHFSVHVTFFNILLKMFVFLVAVVVLFSIFGLTYARTSIRANQEAAGSTIRLPGFMHRTPLIQHPQPGVEGDCGFASRSSEQQPLEPSEDAMAQTTLNEVDERLGVDRYQLERSILDQKIRDANQLGLCTEALWPQGMPEDCAKNLKNTDGKVNTTDASKLARQKMTHTIYNMIQYETFSEAMAALKLQQQEAQPAGLAESSSQQTSATQSNENDVSIDEVDPPNENDDVISKSETK